MTKLKKFEITYAPTVYLVQEAVNPYDDWDVANVSGQYIYVSFPNHKRDKTKSYVVSAVNKECAKALFAVSVYSSYIGKPIKGGIDPLITDRIRNIVSIKEISDNE